MSDVKDTGRISLSVPGGREYLLVIRTALGGVALLKDLTVDQLDDLRQAADEACDCLLHQGRGAETLHMTVTEQPDCLLVTLWASFGKASAAPAEDGAPELTQAILETLIPQVRLHTSADGCVERIDLTLPSARH